VFELAATSHFFTAKTQGAQRHRRRKPQGRKGRQDIAHRNSTQRRQGAKTQSHRSGESRSTGRTAPASSRGISVRKADRQTLAFVESTFRTSGRAHGAPARPRWIAGFRCAVHAPIQKRTDFPTPVTLSYPGPARVDRTRSDIASGDGAEWQAGSLPLQRAERLCSGKLPACHSLVPGEYVIGNERVRLPRPNPGTKPERVSRRVPSLSCHLERVSPRTSRKVPRRRAGRSSLLRIAVDRSDLLTRWRSFDSLRSLRMTNPHRLLAGGTPAPQRRPVLCSAGVPPAPHALMQACWIRVLSTSHRRRDAGATKTLESSKLLPRNHQGGAAVLRAQRPWDRPAVTRTGSWSGRAMPRWRRLETVADSAARETNPC